MIKRLKFYITSISKTYLTHYQCIKVQHIKLKREQVNTEITLYIVHLKIKIVICTYHIFCLCVFERIYKFKTEKK